MHRFLLASVIAIAPLLASASAVEQSGSTQSATSQVASPIDLNTATAAQLETLPGIGARTAERIIEYRQKTGGFKKVEDLMNVRGVGEKSFLKLKPLVTVSAPKTSQ